MLGHIIVCTMLSRAWNFSEGSINLSPENPFTRPEAVDRVILKNHFETDKEFIYLFIYLYSFIYSFLPSL